MNIPEVNRTWNFRTVQEAITALPIGLEINAPDVLFAKIEDAAVETWSERFGGDQ